MDNSEASSRRIRLLIPSGPAALPIGRDFSTVSISLGVNCIKLNQIGPCNVGKLNISVVYIGLVSKVII